MAPAEPPCPVCGNTEWEAGPDAFSLRRGDPRYIRGGGTAVLAFFCTRCEFVRLHRKPDDPGETPTAT